MQLPSQVSFVRFAESQEITFDRLPAVWSYSGFYTRSYVGGRQATLGCTIPHIDDSWSSSLQVSLCIRAQGVNIRNEELLFESFCAGPMIKLVRD